MPAAAAASANWTSAMKSFVIRALSAVVAVLILFALAKVDNGFQYLISLAVLIGGYELTRMLFKPDDSRFNRALFYICNLGIFASSTLHPELAGLSFAFFAIAFCLLSLVTQKKFDSLEALSAFQAKSTLGFFYIGLLPSFAARLLTLPHGVAWLLVMMAIVFAGDTGAYLTGMMLGKHKLMPSVSPKKTIEGSLGGLVCSMIAGGIGAVFVEQPAYSLVILALLMGVVAQFGDLFESLLKRVADVKDSGNIMPGHGGVLDRIDGVLFASPVILLGALFLENRLF